MVSEDQKSVKRLLFDLDVSPNSRRFDQDPCILAQERFEAGRHYWEVEVGNRRAWILGVCLESLVREGRIPKSPQHGLWALEFYKEKLQALSYPRTCLSPAEPLRRVGILLDFEAGEISFRNSSNGSLPYFLRPCLYHLVLAGSIGLAGQPFPEVNLSLPQPWDF